MPIPEWKDEQVNDCSGGITDLVTASGSEFQELCENLGHNPKLQLLSSREGYRRFTSVQTISPITQLFKLEDWILALCENGHIYYRLESDTISAWTKVETPKDRSATTFRVYNSSGKGLTFQTSAPVYDQLVVKGTLYDATVTTPSVMVSGRTITLDVNTWPAFNTADKKFNGGSGNYTFAQLQALFAATWPTAALLTDTLGTDEVIFDGLLAIEENPSPSLEIYPASVRSDGDGTALGFAGEDGHLQGSDWQSHLYLALEPYLKTSAENDSDPRGEDPEAFPPINQRLPLRKIVPFAPAIGASSTATVLKAVNAQLPKTYIGVETNESSTYTDSIAHYRYQVYTLTFEYTAPNHAGDAAEIEIWCERTWGYQGPPSGGMGAHSVMLKHFYVIGTANPVDASLPYALVDPILEPLAGYGSLTTPAWGELFLVVHNPATATREFKEVVEGIGEAFAEYQKRAFVSGGVVYPASYGNFGYYIKVSPKARLNAHVKVEVPGPTITVRYADSLPEDVAGNHRYGFALYLRDTYKAMVEGSPRDFLTDGPAAFLSVRTLSPITDELRRGYTDSAKLDIHTYTYSSAPRIFGGISTAINRDSHLYYQSSLEAVMTRTLDGGDTYFIEKGIKYWYRTDDPSPRIPAINGSEMIPDNLLTGEDWTGRTSYIIAHEPELTDDLLQYEEGAYFNGGILSYDGIPQGPYYFDIVNQVGVAAHIVGNIHRAYLSPPGAPHAHPATVFEDFEDEISGVTHYLDKAIVTTANKLWRIEGVKAADGSGRTVLRTISDEYGCVSNQSIVRTNLGIFLWSKSGIIWTDGLRAIRVNEHLIDRYQTWLSDVRGGEPTIGPEQLRGTYDALNRKVYWSLKDSEGKPFFVVLSLQKGISGAMPIVTESGIRFNSVDEVTGDVTPVDYFETHATLYSEDRQAFYRAQGTYLMVRDADRTYDESHVDETSNPGVSLKHPILPYYKSIAYAYGIPWARKQTSRILLNLRDLTKTGVSLCPLSWNDLSEIPHKLGNCLSYQHMNFALDYATTDPLDLEQFFRHSDARWKSTHVVSYKRGFGKGSQRNLFKQVGFQALKLRYQVIDKDTAGVSLIELTHKAKDGTDFARETVFIDITESGTAVNDLALDASGQFYVAWNDTMEPAPISDIDLVSSPKRITVLPGGSAPTNVSDYIEKWPALSFYRVFTDQKIDMLGYNLTFRLIGDRTHGSLKSTDNGGVDA